MSYRCDNCGKKRQAGRQSTHRRGVAGKQWLKRAQKTIRVFRPNLQKITINGKKLLLCTRCIKKIKSEKKKDNPAETASK